ncbi:MAG: EF-P lysine aminoacylase GenX [Gammaproteobacteria bacterium]|jgi:lysyl-tRNA synthetase class 2|nr:EF-P lysine aminoacylase GenX [Gammaproteobacteria bacterium]MBT4608337.1 EF-P lysine aminoacylase GenX [Thiotrichales bacterium]MBT3471640.1 EF-P lysine aminoacylase GenX [Gammaproteobacteria bacterium]MBT3968557.1 EF-P lysine aminoacylase GenX [Gammaproteobacteria bacterium]MBT4080569.1 EF-P lysine aminoacylase GenX [Gammaproteobacteria bacterium]
MSIAPLLQERATFMRAIRTFFAEREVMEVETPLLSTTANSDPHVDPFSTTTQGRDAEGPEKLYLHTSPEFFMKRLLAEGSGPIFQLGPVFRAGEIGPIHNPEFTMLEWYRPDFSMEQLMDEVEDLVTNFVDLPSIERLTIAEAFEQVGVENLYDTSAQQLQAIAVEMGLPSADELDLDWDSWVDYFIVLAIQPRFAHAALFLTHYPASQAALARISPDNPNVAERFELVLNGIEIANGFHELTDATEQRKRFQKELDQRAEEGLEALPMDEHLLAALEKGLPDCSGVAIGVDRLMMLSMGKEQLSEVMPFPIQSV